ncbi:MAG: hypothetical protein QOH66_2445 [Actinomycetota bacterium]|nr:hypothetical protein [Actinomycetota bacterium]
MGFSDGGFGTPGGGGGCATAGVLGATLGLGLGGGGGGGGGASVEIVTLMVPGVPQASVNVHTMGMGSDRGTRGGSL